MPSLGTYRAQQCTLSPTCNRAFIFTFAPASQSAAYRLPSGLTSAVIANAQRTPYKQLLCAHLHVFFFFFFFTTLTPKLHHLCSCINSSSIYFNSALLSSSPPAITLPPSPCSATRSSLSLRLRWLSSLLTVSIRCNFSCRAA